jgi:hypothetical protein
MNREALAEQPAQPYKGIADHTNQATNGRLKIDPVTGDVGIGTPIAEPVQEPVAEADTGGGMKIDASAPLVMTTHPAFAQRTWVGLTDEEWQWIDASLNGKRDLARIFVRAIEAKLREKNR